MKNNNLVSVEVSVAVAAAKAALFTSLSEIKKAKEARLYASVAHQIAERVVWSAEEADLNIGNGVEYWMLVEMEEARERLEKAESRLASAKSRAAALSKALRRAAKPTAPDFWAEFYDTRHPEEVVVVV